ncbi:succinate-semialdehyde dehydrogenase [Thamnocephalis sphaerospora]|uniref:Succinate-semialdehyde dehydrogenase n=1 Tax=Thamnocephalis sphaerospora TaxID=78915 RepID=A0A4P9XNW6_9FUNG|nr:succinate-semialdehyde dehydrogenase [Thamnocephalis sphaerospora]|eukprot:RKP07664.1 succinate-semialdehyde dehydrogenase [Thamnocephalis sphaerospora]
MPISLKHPSASKLKDHELFRTKAFIDGKWVSANDGAKVAVIDPATGKEIGTVPEMGVEETRAAISAASRALVDWRKTTCNERYDILIEWAQLISRHKEDLALLLTMENGKPLNQSISEIEYAQSFAQWFAEEAKRIYGEVIQSPLRNQRFMMIKQPVGVCSMVTPWNFPSAMITRKMGAALAAGCTVVLKPAAETPYSALALCELATRAGIPKGVVNIVTTDKHVAEVGLEMCTNDLVRKVSFTGSTNVGKLILKQCADGVKRVSLELGGNAPYIVFDDADLESAVEGIMTAKIINAGQVCTAPNRIYVQSGIYDRFSERLAERMRTLHIGSGLEEGVHVGPVITERARTKVHRHVEDAVTRGARVMVGGAEHRPAEGFFIKPTLISDLTDDALVANEETFGPLVAMRRFTTEEEVADLANRTKYGLAGYVFTRDVGRVFRMSESIEAGMICVNSGQLLASEAMPFGGIKESGIGREGSKHGIEEYVDEKLIAIGF